MLSSCVSISLYACFMNACIAVQVSIVLGFEINLISFVDVSKVVFTCARCRESKRCRSCIMVPNRFITCLSVESIIHLQANARVSIRYLSRFRQTLFNVAADIYIFFRYLHCYVIFIIIVCLLSDVQLRMLFIGFIGSNEVKIKCVVLLFSFIKLLHADKGNPSVFCHSNKHTIATCTKSISSANN